jgi:hypothetical protein
MDGPRERLLRIAHVRTETDIGTDASFWHDPSIPARTAGRGAGCR